MTTFPVLFKTCVRVLKYLMQIVRIFIADDYDQKYTLAWDMLSN